MKKIGAVLAIAAMLGVVAWLGVQARDIRNERLEAAERRLQLPEVYAALLKEHDVFFVACVKRQQIGTETTRIWH